MSALAIGELVVGFLLLLGGLFSLTAAVGLLRMPSFFMRMHPPAIANTLAVWCTALGVIIYFYVFQDRIALYVWLIPIFLSITAPITTALLSRAALFRERQQGGDVPPPPGGEAGGARDV